MDDVRELYAAVVILTVLESFFTIDHETLTIRKPLLRAWTWAKRKPGSVLSFRELVFTWGGTLPLSRILFGQTQPICISVGGLVGYPVHTLAGLPVNPSRLFLGWNDVRHLRVDGKKLYFEKKIFARFCSEFAAASKLNQLKMLAAVDHGKRATAICRAIAEEIDSETAGQRQEAVFSAFRDERVLNCAVTIFLLILFPIVAIVGLLPVQWYQLLIVLCLLCIAIAALHSFNSMKFGKLSFSKVLPLIFFPISACRSAQQYVAREVSNFHPLAIAKGLLPSTEFQYLFSEVVRDLQNPLENSLEDEIASACVSECRKAYLSGILSKVREWQIDSGVTVPIRELMAASYCPRCLLQYDRSAGHCSDCFGIKLKPF